MPRHAPHGHVRGVRLYDGSYLPIRVFEVELSTIRCYAACCRLTYPDVRRVQPAEAIFWVTHVPEREVNRRREEALVAVEVGPVGVARMVCSVFVRMFGILARRLGLRLPLASGRHVACPFSKRN